MKLKKYLAFIWICVATICYSNNKVGSDEKDKVIARIGKDYKITLEDLNQYVTYWNYDKRYRDDKYRAYKVALDAMIFNQLKRFDLFDRGINKDRELMKSINRYIGNELIEEYYRKEFVEKYANEKNTAEAYKEMDKEFICQEIILPFSKNPTNEELDSLKAIALTLQSDLYKTNNVKNIIEKIPLKNISVDNQKVITWLESIMEPVANVVFRLQKGFTRVIEASDGVHVIKVIDIKKVKLEPFEKLKGDIILNLEKAYQYQFQKEFEEFKNSLVDVSTLKWNESSIKQIADWSNTDKFFAAAYKDTIQSTIAKGKNFVILSYNNEKVDLNEFLRLVEEVAIINPNEKFNSVGVKQFILEAVQSDKIIKKIQELGWQEKLVNPYTNNPVVKDKLAYLYNQAVIEASIPKATEESLHKFYAEQKDSIFYQLKKVGIYVRIYSDIIEAADEIKKVNDGIPFEKISNRWFNKSFIRKRDGSLESYLSQEKPYLAEAAFKLKLNEVAGPVEYYDPEKGKQFAVIKCSEVRHEKQLTYDDVKDIITKEFTNYYRQKISNEMETMLKKKYNVEIFENTLSQALSSK